MQALLTKRRLEWRVQWDETEVRKFEAAVIKHGSNVHLISKEVGTRNVKSVYNRILRLIKNYKPETASETIKKLYKRLVESRQMRREWPQKLRKRSKIGKNWRQSMNSKTGILSVGR